MPHIIVKLWPGNSPQQKSELAQRITRDVMDVLTCGEKSVSVAFEEISDDDWKKNVYEPDIVNQPDKLYKKPGYTM
ncbi:MAG: tautomerase family protein [Phycisphaerae bacterium]|nr:tautomerase family protein [Phycisphaerae bacterium]